MFGTSAGKHSTGMGMGDSVWRRVGAGVGGRGDRREWLKLPGKNCSVGG